MANRSRVSSDFGRRSFISGKSQPLNVNSNISYWQFQHYTRPITGIRLKRKKKTIHRPFSRCCTPLFYSFDYCPVDVLYVCTHRNTLHNQSPHFTLFVNICVINVSSISITINFDEVVYSSTKRV